MQNYISVGSGVMRDKFDPISQPNVATMSYERGNTDNNGYGLLAHVKISCDYN